MRLCPVLVPGKTQPFSTDRAVRLSGHEMMENMRADEEAPAAGVAVEPIGERFMLTGKIEQLEQMISIQGPWRDLMGVVGAQARYSLDPMPAGYQLLEADLPPDGSYPGRIHFGGSAVRCL